MIHTEKIVLFGDSITASYGEEGVTPILQNLLSEDGMKRLEKEVLVERPDVLTLLFGASDTTSDNLVPIKNIHKISKQGVIKSIKKKWFY